MTEELKKQIEEAAEKIWKEDLGMAEPKYCANGSYEYFLQGFQKGYELRDKYTKTLTIEHGPADMMKKLEKAEAQSDSAKGLLEEIESYLEVVSRDWDKLIQPEKSVIKAAELLTKLREVKNG